MGESRVEKARAKPWLGRDVWAVSLSAFFADVGYQAVQAGFPLMLIFMLHAPVWLYGVASALSYGGGSLFAYLGGRLGDRFGHRRVALLGNSFIPILSFSGLFAAPGAIACLTLGWWARNARSPSRRVMLTEAVPPTYRNEAFGFLHALDVVGSVLAALYVLAMLAWHVPWRTVFLLTILPLAVSTYTLALARTGGGRPPAEAQEGQKTPNRRPAGYFPLLVAAALYGLSYYSVGFPVLTVAQGGKAVSLGIVAFLVLQLISALTGYGLGGLLGKTRSARFRNLALFGYLLSAVGSLLLAYAALRGTGPWLLLLGVGVLGSALGVVETLEPALMSLLAEAGLAGEGFGSLTAARSIGLLLANLVLGLLYTFSAALSYAYAAAVALVAAVILLWAVQAVRREESV